MIFSNTIFIFHVQNKKSYTDFQIGLKIKNKNYVHKLK